MKGSTVNFEFLLSSKLGEFVSSLSISTTSTNHGFLCCFCYPPFKLKGDAARLPAVPSCGVFWYVMQMQIEKQHLREREQERGERILCRYKHSASTHPNMPMMTQFTPCAKQVRAKRCTTTLSAGRKEERKEDRKNTMYYLCTAG